MSSATERCGHIGGQGIGAGHVCICVRAVHPPGELRHGCSCGALWRDEEVNPHESMEVREARQSLATADPQILAAAKARAALQHEEWDELNIMRKVQHLWVARDMVSAAYNVTFSPDNLARTVSATGLSLQTVTEVARELRKP